MALNVLQMKAIQILYTELFRYAPVFVDIYVEGTDEHICTYICTHVLV